MTDAVTLRQRLEEAQAALHALATGTQRVQIRDASGRQISYAPADVGQLRAYIAELKAQLDPGRRRRAIGVWF